MGFKLGKEHRKVRTSKNTPIIRKNLDKGILGEANNDGSIFIDKSVKPGSALEKRVINHEKKHADDMASGILDYGDDWVRYKNKTYHRRDGKIKYNGSWHEEGSNKFPWEKRAKKAVPPIKYAPGNFNKTLCFPAPKKRNKANPARFIPIIG